MSNNYTPTKWIGGRTVGTADVMNNIEQGINGAHDRLDGVDEQFNTITSENKNANSYYSLPRKPLVTFIDDDGNKRIMERLYPLFKQNNIPACCAIITGRTDTHADFLTSDNIKTLVSEGWEMLGHGHSYSQNLGEFDGNDDELDWQLGTGCKSKLESISSNIKVNGFVYPQSYHDRRIRRFTMKNYKFAFGGVGINTNKYINTPLINRVAFGSYTNVNNAINGERDTLAFYKANVDKAIEQNGWLIFMIHCNDHDETQQGYLSELINYIKSKNVDIVTASEGYRHFGNQVFVGDLEENFTVINENGIFTTESESGTIFKTVKLQTNSVLPTTPVAEFPKMTISICEISHSYASSNNFPEGVGGVLITYRHSLDVTYPNNNKQEYWIYGSERVYRRTATNTSSWSSWDDKEPLVLKSSNYKTESDLITSYEDKKITVFSATGSSPFNGRSGIVTTYRTSGNGWNRQELREYNTNKIYVRYVNTDGTWSSWDGLLLESEISTVKKSSNYKTESALITEYDSNKIIIFAVTGSNSFNGKSGIVTTYNISSNGYNRQELREYNSNRVYSRYVTSDGSWSAWEKISAI